MPRAFKDETTEVVDPAQPRQLTIGDDRKTEVPGVADPRVGLLTIVEGPGAGNTFPVYAGQNSIGRGVAARIQLSFGDGRVSARQPHALLECDGGRCVLWETGHQNKVYVNGTVVTGSRALVGGDRIMLGATTLRFTTE